jgi:ABC-type bacteriocin/lantibiotic exporter with double-glycine peptidase domain
LKKGPIPPSGGRYFFQRLELAVPLLRQADERWGHHFLGPTDGTLGAEGCAVASAAMVMNYYGIETDPGRLNVFLSLHEQGYTPQGWIWWEAAADLEPGLVEKAYEDAPSYFLIDSNLSEGHPVIARLRYPNGITHFVVIVGKDGFDYLVQDPGRGGDKGVYPLREFGSDIEAIRFYRWL